MEQKFQQCQARKIIWHEVIHSQQINSVLTQTDNLPSVSSYSNEFDGSGNGSSSASMPTQMQQNNYGQSNEMSCMTSVSAIDTTSSYVGPQIISGYPISTSASNASNISDTPIPRGETHHELGVSGTINRPTVKGILHSYNRNFNSEPDRYIYLAGGGLDS